MISTKTAVLRTPYCNRGEKKQTFGVFFMAKYDKRFKLKLSNTHLLRGELGGQYWQPATGSATRCCVAGLMPIVCTATQRYALGAADTTFTSRAEGAQAHVA